ncbi:MAG: 2-phospho-L-lactate transferase [Antricoccus sp.]
MPETAEQSPQTITVLAGGIGGAKYLQGVRQYAARTGAEVTAIVNTGDDATMHGLRICPDLDSVMYTLGDAHDRDRGWGQLGESWVVGSELKIYGAGPTWFNLGDKDIATHLVRTQMLDAGYPLSAVTAALCDRWQPGVRLLPMSDDRCETHVVVDLPDGTPDQRRAIHFQEWWVRYRADIPSHEFVQIGLDQARPAPGVLDAIENTDLVLIAPSNPVVSIGTIVALPPIRAALRRTSAPVIGTSPLIGNAPLRGMADRCLQIIGLESSARAVGDLYGSRAATGILDGWLVASADRYTDEQLIVRGAPLLMTNIDATEQMVRAAVSIANDVASR